MRATRTRTNRASRPHARPVKNIDLSDKFVKLRIVLAVVFLLIGATAIAVGVASLSSHDTGWQTIEVDSSEYNSSSDFEFLYNIGQGSVGATKEYKAISALYTEACETAFALFSCDVDYDDISNMYYINRHPNEIIEIDPALYKAFELIQASGNRALYLGPSYEYYNGIFNCTEDWQAAEYDPRTNEDAAAYYQAVSSFALDPSMIDLELLGNNTIYLKVSDEYLAFAEENEIETYIDFYWMANAFIIDYLADTMIDAGYTLGSISSYDGFVRNLDTSGTLWTYTLYTRDELIIYPCAQMQFGRNTSIVYLHDYAISSDQLASYYIYADGTICSPYLDPLDGMDKSATPDLLCYSQSLSCAELLLDIFDIYVADTLDTAGLINLSQDGIQSMWCQNATVIYTDPSLLITYLYAEDDKTYTTQLAA